jgi:serine/threonine-protein kinase
MHRVAAGHLIYMSQGTIFAVPFDLDRLETTGPAVPALEGVQAAPAMGSVHLALSRLGPSSTCRGRPWLRPIPSTGSRATARPRSSDSVKADWRNPRFSPDGQKLAIDISDGSQRDIWLYESGRATI